jgi:uncharacterized protein DUF397
VVPLVAPDNLVWVRGSSCADGACAEVAADGEFVYLRNSREPDKIIKLDRDDWAAFRAAIHAGQF